MIAVPAGDAIATIEGERAARHLVFVVRQGCAPADALHEALNQVLTADDGARARGFCRELQKTLENQVVVVG